MPESIAGSVAALTALPSPRQYRDGIRVAPRLRDLRGAVVPDTPSIQARHPASFHSATFGGNFLHRCQAAGLWERALEVAEAHDGINLSATHQLYAQHLEKVRSARVFFVISHRVVGLTLLTQDRCPSDEKKVNISHSQTGVCSSKPTLVVLMSSGWRYGWRYPTLRARRHPLRGGATDALRTGQGGGLGGVHHTGNVTRQNITSRRTNVSTKCDTKYQPSSWLDYPCGRRALLRSLCCF